MWSTYLLIFLMLCIGAAGWLLFIWAVKSGQYDDVEGPKFRMLDDDDGGAHPPGRAEQPRSQASGTPAGRNNDDGPTP